MASKPVIHYAVHNGIAVISQTTQAADNKGEDTNVPVQVNPVGVKP